MATPFCVFAALFFMCNTVTTFRSSNLTLPTSLNQITLSRSNNLLYPKENRAEKKLMYSCGRCRYEQEAEHPVVFRHEMVKSERCVT